MEVARKSLPPGPGPTWTTQPGFKLSNHSQSLMANNFVAFCPKESKFFALKILNPFKAVSKGQEASRILRVGFDRLKWPHLRRAYLVTVCNRSFITVTGLKTEKTLLLHYEDSQHYHKTHPVCPFLSYLHTIVRNQLNLYHWMLKMFCF